MGGVEKERQKAGERERERGIMQIPQHSIEEEPFPNVVSHTCFRAIPLTSQFVFSGIEQGEERVDSQFFGLVG